TRASLGSLTVPTIAPLLFWATAETAKMKVNKTSSGSWADSARGFLIFDSSRAESKTQTTRSDPRVLGELFLKPTWIDRGEWLNTSVLALQNLVCCRSE